MKDYGAKREDVMKIKSESSPQSTISSLNGGKAFRINDNMEIVAEADKTRNGFKHTATLFVDGRPVDKATAHYLNRTWESYEYQTVIDDLINKSSYIPKDQKEILKEKFAGKSHEEIQRKFGTIGNIASLGEIFGKTKKEKNEFKLRMINAGLGKGFQVPENWNELSEDEKEIRLNKVIKELQKK